MVQNEVLLRARTALERAKREVAEILWCKGTTPAHRALIEMRRRFFRENDIEHVDCETCGVPTDKTGTKRCDSCWEVEHRLSEYLTRGRSTAAERIFVALEKAIV